MQIPKTAKRNIILFNTKTRESKGCYLFGDNDFGGRDEQGLPKTPRGSAVLRNEVGDSRKAEFSPSLFSKPIPRYLYVNFIIDSSLFHFPKF